MTKIPNKSRVKVVRDPEAPPQGIIKHLVGKTGIVVGSQLGSGRWRHHYYYGIRFDDNIKLPNFYIHEDSLKVI